MRADTLALRVVVGRKKLVCVFRKNALLNFVMQDGFLPRLTNPKSLLFAYLYLLAVKGILSEDILK